MLFHNAKKMSEMLTHPMLKETFNTMKEHVKDTHLSPDGNGYVVPISFYRNGRVISGDLHVMERLVHGESRLQVIIPVNLVPPGSIQFYPLGIPDPPYGAWTFLRKNGNNVAVTMNHDPVENYLTVRETSNTHLTFPALLADILNTLVIEVSRIAAEARQKRIRRSKSFWAMQLHVERMQRQARRANKKWCISETAKKFKPKSLDTFLKRKTPRTHPLLPPT